MSLLIANNNRKPAWKLVLKALRADKFRTFCILFAICTCTFLMTFLPCFNTLDYRNLYEEFEGQEHATFTSLSPEEISAVSGDPHLEKVLLEKYGDLGKLNGEYARPVFQETAAGKFPDYRLLDGSLPKKPGDILLDGILAEKLQASPGDTCNFHSKDKSIVTFQVSGIIQESSGSSIPCFYMSPVFGEADSVFAHKAFRLNIWLKPEYLSRNFDKSASLIYQLGQTYGIPESNILINVYSIDSDPLSLPMILAYVFLDLMILVIGLLVIYSIFYISIMSRIRAFGQMQTLGMTARQIRNMVNKEGTLLCLLGSLGGILPGLLLAAVAARRWEFPYMAWTGVLVFISTYIFIMAFLQKPARMASRITPWEALTYQENIFFPFSGKISCRTLGKMRVKKSRKKMHLTRISIITGGIFFILTVTYMTAWKSDFRVRSGYFQNADYILIYNSEYLASSDTEQVEYQKENVLNQQLLDKLKAFPDVEKVFPVREEYVTLLTGYGSEPVNIIAFDEETFALIRPYLTDSNVTYAELVRSGGILYNPMYDYGKDFEEKKTFSLSYYDGDGYQDIALPVLGIVDPVFFQDHISLNASLLAPISVMKKMYPGINTISTIYITTKEHKSSPELKQFLNEFTQQNPLIRADSFEDYQRELDRQNLLLMALFSGATLIVILFSILNLLNSTLNRMVIQNRELALFEVVGMSQKEIKKMLLWEGLYMSRMPLAVSWILGIGLNFLFYKLLLAPAGLGPYRFPLISLLLWMAFVLGIHWGITLLCYRHFTKNSLMERLKKEE